MVKGKYVINDTFKIIGRGMVLAGFIDEGSVTVGDYIEFTAFEKPRRKRITGVEGITISNPSRANTGLLIDCEDDSEMDELRLWRPKGIVGTLFTSH